MDKNRSTQFQYILGNLLQSARKQSKMSQEQFANNHNCSINYISQIERGNIKLPAEVLLWYCKEFNLSSDDLYDQVEKSLEKATSSL